MRPRNGNVERVKREHTMDTGPFWHRVLATHEERQQLAGGGWLGDDFIGVALPHRKALGRKVEIRYRNAHCIATVADVGPWCIDDQAYVFGADRPRAEKLAGEFCSTQEGMADVPTVPDGKGGTRPAPRSNGAGIDLFPATAQALGIPIGHNVVVEWRFADV